MGENGLDIKSKISLAESPIFKTNRIKIQIMSCYCSNYILYFYIDIRDEEGGMDGDMRSC